ncbi:type II restriction enzyme [Leifsonia psychrotolerans]|uniref:Type II restriction enzyme n=1 Tax=Glaciibacter psychrotolerans TaxID=670054 RepID=A0A7Z0EDH8_9MICO|nr:type II restriction enzyme [Leifsonia psychrotolerans]
MLEALGFDKAQSGDRSAWTLLALLQLKPGSAWAEAQSPMLGTHAIMGWVRQHYGKDYAPNSRETFRRQTLHQFVDAGLVVYNADDPGRVTNSKDNNYMVAPEGLALLQTFGTSEFEKRLAEYLVTAPGLKAKYAAAREMTRIPVTLPDGTEIDIAGGGQNVLIKAMVEDFCPRFTPGGHVLYIGDADAKLAVFLEDDLAALGVTIDSHGKMPDLVVHQADKNWLFLMEAASTHGPVDGKRHGELAKLFSGSTAGLVYVSAFPDRKTMRGYLADLAWETEAWTADEPSHMMHLNGDRFLGPHERTRAGN